jgi:hypothetical protein
MTTPAVEDRSERAAGPANGAAIAAFLAAGIGALAVGLFVILAETDLFSAPALYAPAGGVSGRTTFAAAVWLIAWAVLHRRWAGREVEPRRVHLATLALVALGVLLCFPPLWALL